MTDHDRMGDGTDSGADTGADDARTGASGDANGPAGAPGARTPREAGSSSFGRGPVRRSFEGDLSAVSDFAPIHVDTVHVDTAHGVDDGPRDDQQADSPNGPRYGHTKAGFGWQLLGVFAELLLTLAAICGLYIAWQMWWTGVQSEHLQQQQLQSVGWSDPAQGGQTKIAAPQQGDPPVQPQQASDGDLIAQIYVPRFGDQWRRTVVQGTGAEELNKHGMGHYPDTQMPGQLGNMAIAGHRNGYGQPLGDVDKLQSGDPIVLRTKDYWYVYRYTTNKIVLPEQVDVIAPNPDHPGQPATTRMITLTTCEPKYSTPTHRWISHGELAYWAKGSDGIPKELSATDGSGAVRFVNNQTQSPMSKLSSLVPVMQVALLCYLVLFIAAAAAWRWPARRAIREGRVRRPAASIYGSILRLQPGVAPVRFLLLLILLVVSAAALLQWGFPWAATTIPYLRSISSFVTV